jgi:Glycosyl transferase family 2
MDDDLQHHPEFLPDLIREIEKGHDVVYADFGTKHQRVWNNSYKSVNYRGLDINAKFIKKLVRCGAQGEVWDLRGDKPLPPADYVIMQSSLYHFLPNSMPIIIRMLAAARTALIIAEPIRNLAQSKLPIIRSLTPVLTNPGVGPQPRRFTEQSLDGLFAGSLQTSVRAFFISGGREKIYRIAND